MRKIREVLRLRFELGLAQDQIARSCAISQTTVHRYLERAAAATLSWPLPADCDDHRLQPPDGRERFSGRFYLRRRL
jgi:hypothetical protein